jgi:PsbP-like protein
MKYLLTFFCLSIVFTGSAQKWETYSNDSILFSAKYPSNWVNKIKEGNRVFFTSPMESDADNFKENINISVTPNEEFGTKYKIKDMVPDILEELKSAVDEMTVETQRDFKWNGADAVELVYVGYAKSDNTLKVRLTQWFCFAKQRLYVATYTASADNTLHTETANKILNSIKFK